uniref:UPAR/Ly6 domain-containing protein n=1 Tax=Mola mola TaxID=94237 RepID=A0A3Q3WHT6_MOLML
CVLLPPLLYITLSCGLRCYTCTATDPKSCTDTKSCPVIFNRCYNMVTKGCQTSLACIEAMACCKGSLCNSAKPTVCSVLLLLVSSAIVTLFL